MREKSSIAPRLPEIERSTEGQPAGPGVVSLIARVESLRNSLKNNETKTAAFDALAAPCFDRAAAVYGAASLAAELQVDDSHLSRMRSGQKPVPIRALLPLIKEPRALIAFCAPLCHEAGLEPPRLMQRVTREQVVTEFMRSLLDSPPLLRLLVADAARAFGVSADEVLSALGSK